MYEMNIRLRFSETDENGKATIFSLVNFLQDCSTFHSMDVGQTIERLREQKLAWLLSYWDIYIDRLPDMGDRLTIGTCPREARGVIAKRGFWIRDGKGYLLRADSHWFLYDTEKNRPVRITEEMYVDGDKKGSAISVSGKAGRKDVTAELKKIGKEGEYTFVITAGKANPGESEKSSAESDGLDVDKDFLKSLSSTAASTSSGSTTVTGNSSGPMVPKTAQQQTTTLPSTLPTAQTSSDTPGYWVPMENLWAFMNPDGKYAQSQWISYKGKEYYIGANFFMETNTLVLRNGHYWYTAPDGVAVMTNF